MSQVQTEVLQQTFNVDCNIRSTFTNFFLKREKTGKFWLHIIVKEILNKIEAKAGKSTGACSSPL